MLGGIVIEEKPAGNGVNKADTATNVGTVKKADTVQKSSAANKVGTVNKAGVAKTSSTVRKTAPIKKTGTAGKGVSSLLIVIVAIILVVAAVGAAVLFMGGSGKSAPVANFKADVTSGVAPLTVHFTDLSKNSPDQWLWDFGDGKSSQEQSPVHQYTAAGSYTVSLWCANDNGEDTYTMATPITVTSGGLAASFSATPLSGKVPLEITFADASSGATRWEWDFDGDGTIDSTEKTPSHTYTSAGKYSVTLTVYNSAGAHSTKTEIGYIDALDQAPPKANFTASPTVVKVGRPVQFTDHSLNGPTNWTWDFDTDGKIDSYEQSPQHSFSAPGYYTVKLTVTNADGQDEQIRNAYINVLPLAPPKADFTADRTHGWGSLGVHFTDQSTGTITNRTWDFGDGNVSYEQNPYHEFGIGTFDVTLTVTNDDGSNTSVKVGLITVLPNPPVAAFTWGQVSGQEKGLAPMTVQFTDTSSNSPTSWAWDFDGDGVTDNTTRDPLHTFTLPGDYTVTLTAANAGGHNSTSVIIKVSVNVPDADFEVRPPVGHAPLTVQFVDLSQKGPTEWAWDFYNDGDTDSREQSPWFTFDEPGVYSVKLTVTNANGSTFIVKEVRVYEPLEAAFDTNVTGGHSPLAVQFTDRSSNATAWFWDFGDGTNSTERSPSHNYTAPGRYTVTLTISNGGGSHTLVEEDLIVVLHDPPVAAFTVSTSGGQAPLTVQFTDTSAGNRTGWHWVFGDGFTSDEQNPTHTYTGKGIYYVNLTVTNDGGSDFKNVTECIKVQLPAEAKFDANPAARGNIFFNVTFVDRSTNAEKWEWDFGDGSTSTEQNPWHIYWVVGNYTVTLTVSNQAGDVTTSDTTVLNIEALPRKPLASFTATVTSGSDRAPVTVQFNDASSNTPTSWAWDFDGDGVIDSTEQNPVWTYTVGGDYYVTLTATNWGGNSTHESDDPIKVKSAPLAAFTADPLVGNAPSTVRFTDASRCEPTWWNWSFGDGTYRNYTERPDIVEHTYSTSRVYEVTLTVGNALGQDRTTLLITVKVALPGVAFDMSPASGNDHMTVYFEDRSADRDDWWEWDFDGDGIVDSYDQNPVWTYTSAGTYHPSLTVRNEGGYTTLVRSVTVSPGQDWTMFHGDLQLTGVYGGAGPVNGHVLWSNIDLVPVPGSSVVSADGVIYMITAVLSGSSSELYLNAVNASTGAVKWSQYLYRTSSGSWTTPCYYDGIIYVQGSGARYASNGSLCWPAGVTLPAGGNGSPLAWGDLVYISNGNRYDAYYRSNGTLKWSFDTVAVTAEGTFPLTAAGTPALVDGKLIVTAYGTNTQGYLVGAVFCLNASGGQKIWQHLTDQQLRGSPAVAYGKVYVASYASSGKADLYAVNLTTGTRDWILSGVLNSTAGTPAVAAGRVFISGCAEGSALRSTVCVDAYSGEALWKVEGIGSRNGSLVYANGVVYVGTDVTGSRKITALSATDGKVLWSLAADGPSPVIVGGRLYLSGAGGLCCICDRPEASFTWNNHAGTPGTSFQFWDASDNTPTSWAWDFDGDGIIDSHEQNPQWTYPTLGTYTVTLTATNSWGSDTEVKVALITIQNIPQADFDIDPQDAASGGSEPQALSAPQFGNVLGYAPFTVHFRDTSSGDPGAWSWDFGDGTTSTEQNPSHTYARSGNYTVSLMVSNLVGQDTLVRVRVITVGELPVAAFTQDVSTGYDSVTVHFTDASSGSPARWEWDFDMDGVADNTTRDPVFTFDRGGQYSVSLTVTNYWGTASVRVVDAVEVFLKDTWPSFHGTSQHTGWSNSSAPQDGKLSWRSEGLYIISGSSPVYGDGMVFFKTCAPPGSGADIGMVAGDHYVTAVSILDGSVAWTSELIGKENNASWDSPEFFDRMVYASGGDRTVCLDAYTGAVIWSFTYPSGKRTCNGGPMVAENKVICSDWAGGYYYCLDAYNGTLLWSYKTTGALVQGTPAYHDGKVFLSSYTGAGQNNNSLACVDMKTGREIWNFRSPNTFCGSPTVYEGLVHIAWFWESDHLGFYALHESNGTVAWRTSANIGPFAYGTDSTPAVAYGKVYYATGDGGNIPCHVFSYDALTGKVVRYTTEGLYQGTWTNSPIVAGGLVFAGVFGAGWWHATGMVALNASDLSVIWSSDLGGENFLLVNGTLITWGSEDGKTAGVYAFRDGIPEPAFDVSASEGVAPLTVRFTDRTVGATAWAWDLDGDGVTDSYEQNPQWTYTENGKYSVRLIAYNERGSAYLVEEDLIVVGKLPVASFDSDVTSGTTDLTVRFHDTSANAPFTWTWDFGDGNTSSKQHPSHTYTGFGNYTVTLTVINKDGSATVTKTNYIRVAPVPPTANFTADVTAGPDPLTVRFTDLSTNAANWTWDLDGDGFADSYLQNPTWNYSTFGNYTVTLTVINKDGSATVTKTNYIQVHPARPTAKFTMDPTTGEDPLTVVFTDRSAGYITNWTWDFGDGTTAYGQNVTHQYHAGMWTVTLTVSNYAGNHTMVSEHLIVVYSPPSASFTYEMKSDRAPMATVLFNDTSTGFPDTWSWDFGDGTTSSERNPRHSYVLPGSYVVTLTVSNPAGTSDYAGIVTVREAEGGTSQYGADAANTGFVDEAGPGLGAGVLWTSQDLRFPQNGQGLKAGVVYGDGKIFVITNGGRVFALNATTGAVAWSITAQGLKSPASTYDSSFDTATAAYHDHRLYVMTYTWSISGRLYGGMAAIDTTDGVVNERVKWFKTGFDARHYNGLTLDRGYIYVSDRGSVQCIDALDDGRTVWTRPGDAWGPLAVAGDHVVVACANGTVLSYHRLTGDLAGSAAVSGIVSGTFTAAGGVCYSPETGSVYLYCNNTADGRSYLVSLGMRADGTFDPARSYAVDLGSRTDGAITGTPSYHDGKVYCYTNYPYRGLACLDAYNGARLWAVNNTNAVAPYGQPVIALDSGNLSSLIIYTGKGVAVGGDGQVRWDLSLSGTIGGTVYQSPALANGKVYFASTNGYVYCIGLKAPLASFTPSPAVTNLPNSQVTFTDGSNHAAAWYWEFGDGTTSTERNPVHTYTAVGNYTVNLTVTNALGSNTTTRTVKILTALPAAGFSANVTEGPAPLVVRFTDDSTGATSWLWSFGDGTTSTERNPVHTYSSAGTYTVTLTASNWGGSSVTTAPILAYGSPAASFTYTAAVPARAPAEVRFDSTASTGPVTAWSWSFGDGATSTEQNPVHTYTAAGSYTVTLTVSNPAGNHSKTVIITVEPKLPDPPVAAFTASKVKALVGDTITFTDTSTGTITSRAWNFGDWGGSGEPNPSHKYTTPGIYTVTLIVENPGGSNSTTLKIEILAKVVANFVAADMKGQTNPSGGSPLEVHFTDISTGGQVVRWEWDFDMDGEVDSTMKDPIHTYTKPGRYTVSLTVYGYDDLSSNRLVRTYCINVTDGTPTWTQYQSDWTHNGVVSGAGPSAELQELWSHIWANVTSQWYTSALGVNSPDVTSSGWCTGQPVVYGNLVIMPGSVRDIYAFDLTTGELVWSYSPGATYPRNIESRDSIFFQQATSGVLAGDTYWIVQGLSGDNGVLFRALDPATGNVKIDPHTHEPKDYIWKVTGNGYEVPNGYPTYSDGMLIVPMGQPTGGSSSVNWNSTAQWEYVGFNTLTGKVAWRYPVAEYKYPSSGATVVGDCAVFPSGNTLVSVNKYTGTVVATLPLSSIDPSLGTARGVPVYVAANLNSIFFTATDINDPLKGYCVAVGMNGNGTFRPSDHWTALIGASYGTPTVSGGWVYVGSDSNEGAHTFFCFRAADGAFAWSTNTEDGSVRAAPTVAHVQGTTLIYVSAFESGTLYVYNQDGTRLKVWTPPDQDDWDLRNYTGYIYGIDKAGNKTDQYGRAFSGPILVNGVLYYNLFGGGLYALGPVRPVANFTVDRAFAFPSVPRVNFIDTSTGGPTEWHWDFGDGTTSDEQYPYHDYTVPGVYTVTLTASSPNGASTKIMLFEVIEDPMPKVPNNVTWAPQGDRTVLVTWDPPDDYGYPVLGYVMTVNVAGLKGSQRTIEIPGDAIREFRLEDLTPGVFPDRQVIYRVNLTAINEWGMGETVTLWITAGAPTAPTNLQYTRSGDSATLSWSVPNSTNGAAVIRYHIYRDGVLMGNTTSLTYVIELVPGQAHRFSVVAVNARGEGPPATVPIDTRPAAPELSAVQDPGQQLAISLTWTVPADGGSPITGYVIYRNVNGNDVWYADIPDPAATTYTKIVSPGSYTFKVSAVNEVGVGPKSDPVTVTVTSGG